MSERSRVLLGGAAIALIAVAYLQAERAPAVSPTQVPAISQQASDVRPAPATAHAIARPPAAHARQAKAAASAPALDRAVLDKYCATCHNERRKTAGLALDKMDVDHIGDNAEVWEKVVSKLRSREMPPAGSPRPDAAAYQNAVTALETALDRAAAVNPNAGRVLVHRLNRTEYANAIRDMLALEIDPAKMLGPDETGYGFDNIADVLTISPGLLEGYKIAAWKISRLAIGDPAIRPSVETYPVSRFIDQEYRVSEELPFGSRGGTVIHHDFPLDGEYVLRIGLQKAYAQNIIVGLNEKEQIDVRLNGEPIKLFTIGGECVGSKEARCQSFRPKLNVASGVRVIPSEYQLFADKILEVRFPAKAGPATLTVSFVDKSATVAEGGGASRKPLTGYQGDTGEGIMGVDNVRIEGPFESAVPKDTPSRRKIFTCHPAAGPDETACARQILSTLARRAYRRPVTDREVATLLGFYEKGRGARGFESGIQVALEALLLSPNFLLRVEHNPASATETTAPAPQGVAYHEGGAPYRIDDLDLASRLSFFLWSSIPDDELLNVAAAGKLRAPKMLEQQVRRMLADPKSKALVDSFFTQWLSLRDLKNVAPDPILFPDFDDNLRDAFLQETRMFVQSQLGEDRPATDLLTADYTFLNERLAQFYGVPNVYGARFRRVEMTDPNRRGLLGQGSILTVTSYSTRTSPVVRGKWLLSNILGSPPPSPPPNVPALVENGTGAGASVRARMEEHRKNPVCASCHRRIDPMGFSLENFSAIGRWRTTEYGKPIDATGAFPDGTSFSNPAEFRKALQNQNPEFLRTVTTKLLTYALGRGLEYYDMPAVRSIMRDAASSNYRWSALMLGIVKSTPFQMNQSVEPDPTKHSVAPAR